MVRKMYLEGCKQRGKNILNIIKQITIQKTLGGKIAARESFVP